MSSHTAYKYLPTHHEQWYIHMPLPQISLSPALSVIFLPNSDHPAKLLTEPMSCYRLVSLIIFPSGRMNSQVQCPTFCYQEGPHFITVLWDVPELGYSTTTSHLQVVPGYLKEPSKRELFFFFSQLFIETCL